MAGPPWLGATVGSAGLASQINQFLAAHAVTFVYAGATVASQVTLGSGSVSTDALNLAQKFTTGAGTTSIGRVVLDLGYVGTPPGPLTVSLYADSAGPTGAPLAQTVVPRQFLTAAGAAVSIPLPAAVAASTTYWIVLSAEGDAGDYYEWFKSNQTSGASTSPDGVTWTAQAYGFYFDVFDQTVTSGGLTHTWEDLGARWQTLTVSGGVLTKISEYTAGQTANGYTVSVRTLSYSATAAATLTGVA